MTWCKIVCSISCYKSLSQRCMVTAYKSFQGTAQILFKEGVPLSQIARKLHRSVSVIHKWVQLRQIPDYGRKRPRRGRPRVIPEKSKQKLETFLLRYDTVGCDPLSLKTQKVIGTTVSGRTLQRFQKECGIKWGKPRPRPPLSETTRLKRLRWCKKLSKLTEYEAMRYVFSDEKIYRASSGPRALRYRRGQQPTKVKTRSAKKLHVWWAIHSTVSFDTKTVKGTLNAAGYQKILRSALIPKYKRGMIFLQDNCSVHTAKTTKEFLKVNNIDYINDFPPYSPDLNVIENLWGYVDYRLGKINRQSKDFAGRVSRTLKEIPREIINNLIKSLPKRIKACLEAEGGYTKY